MISFSGIRLCYGEMVLAENVTFSVAPGEVLLLAGPNGSGKSTLLRALSPGGVLLPTGIPKLRGFSVDEFVRTSLYRISDWAGRLDRAASERAEKALGDMGLEGLRGRDVSTLSDGEFQKAAIAATLSLRTPLLLLDEPTAFLDAGARQEVLSLIHRAARESGTAVIFSSHDLSVSLRFSDRALALPGDGRFLISGTDPESKVSVLEEAFGKKNLF